MKIEEFLTEWNNADTRVLVHTSGSTGKPKPLWVEKSRMLNSARITCDFLRLKAGDTAVIFGLGPIGLLIVEALRAAGASKIYAVELSPERQAKAEELGAIVVRPEEGETVVEAIHRLTGGGADVSYEVTGVPVVLGQALAAVHKAGECMVVSIWEREASINPNEFAIQEKSLKGIIAYRHIFPKVLELMEQGYFSAEKLVTKKIKLENIVEEGFVELTQDKSQIKILVQPE